MAQLPRRERGQIRLARQAPPEPSDGILDPTLLPRRVRIAEEGRQAEPVAQTIMQGKLGAVVEGQRAPHRAGQPVQATMQPLQHGPGRLVGQPLEDEQAGAALMQ
jgi:hypothetical protein